MQRYTGRTAYGIRMPLKIDFTKMQDEIIDYFLKAHKAQVAGFYVPNKGGVLGITESLVARGQNNYITKNMLAKDLESKLIDGKLVLLFPILSRNRFLPILEAIAKIKREITIVLHAPSDEMGNPLVKDALFWDETDALTEKEFYSKHGVFKHPYTEIDYVQLYKGVRDDIQIIVTNNPSHAAKFGENILVCTTHDRFAYRDLLKKGYPNKNVLTLCNICTEPTKDNKDGFNPEYGILGANMADDTRIKLFPRDCFKFVYEMQKKIYNRTNKLVEVLIFGDGAYKDPSQQIWELADPVTCPGYTMGLIGTPNEVKLKYLLDTYKGDQTDKHISDIIEKSKSINKSKETNESLGTTPRNNIDLLASLCDLVTGSGNAGTPVVYINGFFDNYFDGFPLEITESHNNPIVDE